MAEEKKTVAEKLHAISTPAEENWLEIADKWEEEDKVLEELIKYFQGLWPGIETAEQCNTDMHFTPTAILRLACHFAEWQKEQMLKDAVEATIMATKCGDKYQQLLITDWNDSDGLYNGDNVKVVIIPQKEDKK